MSFSVRITLIVAFIVALAAVAFALQNAEVVVVSFLLWSFESSLALVLLITFLLGVVSGALFALSRSFSKKNTSEQKGVSQEQ